MQALTVRSPWAWAIARGWKPVENRGRRVPAQASWASPSPSTLALDEDEAALPDPEAAQALAAALAQRRPDVRPGRCRIAVCGSAQPPPTRTAIMLTMGHGRRLALADRVSCAARRPCHARALSASGGSRAPPSPRLRPPPAVPPCPGRLARTYDRKMQVWVEVPDEVGLGSDPDTARPAGGQRVSHGGIPDGARRHDPGHRQQARRDGRPASVARLASPPVNLQRFPAETAR